MGQRFSGRAVVTAAVLALALSTCSLGESREGRAPPPTSTGQDGAVIIEQGFSCAILGTDADDVLVGTAASEVICGGAGNDLITGGPGNDTLAGGSGNDVLRGGSGADVLLGGAGNDALRGGEGDDRLRGGDGADALADAAGRDRLVGGDGRDSLRAKDRQPYDLVAGGADVDLCVADAGDWRTGCGHPVVASHARRVPVLMYHVIADPQPGTPNIDLWVSPRTFAAQMRWLDRHGYNVVNLQDVYDYWHGGPLPRKAIVVSFDDGFDGHYRRARPILARHGWPGTLNLALSHYGPDLSRGEIRALIAANWELDSHTLSHAFLPRLSATRLRAEVSGSRRLLRRRFHVPVNFFCYPAGAYDARVVAAVRAAGYQGATTTEYGLASRSEPFTMDRVRVSHGDGVTGLARKLRALLRDPALRSGRTAAYESPRAPARGTAVERRRRHRRHAAARRFPDALERRAGGRDRARLRGRRRGANGARIRRERDARRLAGPGSSVPARHLSPGLARPRTHAMAFSNVARALASAVLILSSFAFTSCSGGKERSGVATSGATTVRETTSNGTTSEPPLDPEGEKIAFLSDRDGNFEIYLMNTDGTEVTRLTETEGREGEPVWSSDGRRIAFERETDGNADVYVMNSDGSGEMRLTQNEAYDGDPAWSPDGTKIAFETDRDGDFELFVMNADGTGVTRLTRNRTGDTSPAWSPDGARILFARGDGDQFEIYLMKADGSEQTRVTKFRGPDIFPAWAPDGGSFAFMGGYEINVATADGITRLTKNRVWDAVPSWSPNGSKIAFERERDGNFDIYVMNADGSEQTRLTHEPAIDRFPAWSPAGNR